MTAMRNSQDAGIYLVGWFDTEKWDPEDSRRGRVPNMPIEGLRRSLATKPPRCLIALSYARSSSNAMSLRVHRRRLSTLMVQRLRVK